MEEIDYIVENDFVLIEIKFPSGSIAKEGYGYTRRITPVVNNYRLKAGESVDIVINCEVWNQSTNSYMLHETADYGIEVMFNNQKYALYPENGVLNISFLPNEAGKYTIFIYSIVSNIGDTHIGVDVYE